MKFNIEGKSKLTNKKQKSRHYLICQIFFEWYKIFVVVKYNRRNFFGEKLNSSKSENSQEEKKIVNEAENMEKKIRNKQ